MQCMRKGTTKTTNVKARIHDIDGFMQEMRNFIGNPLELRLSCTNSSILELYAIQVNTIAYSWYWVFWNSAWWNVGDCVTLIQFAIWTFTNSFIQSLSISLININHARAWHQICHKAWWRYQMETFSALLAICAGNSSVLGEFLAQRPVTRGFDFSLICVWINGWVDNRESGDLRRYRVYYVVIIMLLPEFIMTKYYGIYICR